MTLSPETKRSSGEFRCRWFVLYILANAAVATGCDSSGPAADAPDAAGDAPAETATDGDATGPAPSDAGDAPIAEGPGGDAGSDAGGDGTDGGGDSSDTIGDADSGPGADAPSGGGTCSLGAAWSDLGFRVVGSAYVHARGLLVLLPSAEQAIHVIDPDTCQDTRIPIARLPLSVAISPSSATVAVGQDGMLSIVDLASLTVSRTITVPAPATDLAFNDQGQVLVYTRAAFATQSQLYVVGAADGTVRSAGYINADGHIVGTPDGGELYWVVDNSTSEDDMARVVFTGNMVASVNPYLGPKACHQLFPTNDSNDLVTACGTVLRTSKTDVKQDLSFQATLEGVARLYGADTLIDKELLAAIPAPENPFFPPAMPVDNVVRIHDTKFFNLVKTLPLPNLVEDSVNQVGAGRDVFLRADGLRAYVIATRNSKVGLREGIARLDTQAADGEAPPAVILPPAPPLESKVPPPITVARAAAALDFVAIDAGYSRSLDRLVISSNYLATSPTSPTQTATPAVYLVEPATGHASMIAAPALPTTVAVRPDGLVAAVTRSGGITFLDLQGGKVLREQDGPAKTVAFGQPPEVLLATSSTGLSWLNTDTGAVRPALYGLETPLWFATVPGTSTFYSANDFVTISRHDDLGKADDPGISLDPYKSEDTTIRPECRSPFWISDDGTRLVMNCGRVFTLSPNRAADLTYAGSLAPALSVVDVAFSSTAHRIFVLPGLLDQDHSSLAGFDRIAVFDDPLLNLQSTIDIGKFPNTNSLSRAVRLFLGPTPKQLYLLIHSDSADDAPNAVYTLDVSAL